MKKKIKNKKINNLIDVSNKKNITVIEYKMENLDEEELKRLLDELNELHNKIKSECYSSNIAIEKTKHRNFFDLLKLFIFNRNNQYSFKNKK